MVDGQGSLHGRHGRCDRDNSESIFLMFMTHFDLLMSQCYRPLLLVLLFSLDSSFGRWVWAYL